MLYQLSYTPAAVAARVRVAERLRNRTGAATRARKPPSVMRSWCPRFDNRRESSDSPADRAGGRNSVADAAGRGADLAALRWQMEIGVRDAVADSPVDRFRLAEEAAKRHSAGRPRRVASAPATAADARRAAESAPDLPALLSAIESFDGCALKPGAKNTVIADGNPRARVMIVGEAPGAEEDRLGRPFVGPSGQLLDRALAAIGLDRRAEDPQKAVYITNIVFWRPPNNRTPTPDEMALLLPFTERHIALAKPEFLFPLGNVACKSLLRTDTGIMKLRGQWRQWRARRGEASVPALPSFHPSFLLRTPSAKRLFWQDLQSLRDRLADGGSADG